MTPSAIILAAGMSTRLGDATGGRPKGFIRLGERPIVEESVLRLQQAGVGSIVIVTGYGAEHYRALAAAHPSLVRVVHNPRFAESGSLYSLYLARGSVTGPFLLLESDLVYEPRALHELEDAPEDAVLLSGPTGAGDEVWVETREGRLIAMSKDRAELSSEPAGELVGISKISPALHDRVVAYAERAFERSLHVDYETDGLVAAGRERAISCPLVEDLLWAEIDDERHLTRARDTVYPRLPVVA